MSEYRWAVMGPRQGPQAMRLAVFALLVVWPLVGACSSSPQRSPSSSPPPTYLLPPSPAALPDFDPIRFQQLLGQLRGRPVVVNVWASWCGPCVAEAPILSRAATDYGGRVQFLGVDVLDQRTAARAFIRKYEWPFPSVFDRDGAIRDELGLIGQPHTLVIDATGTIVFTWSGAITESRLREELDRLA